MRLGPLHPGELVRQVPARTAAQVARSRQLVAGWGIVLAIIGAPYAWLGITHIADATATRIADATATHVLRLAMDAPIIDCAARERSIACDVADAIRYEHAPAAHPRALSIGDGAGRELARFDVDGTTTIRGRVVIQGKNGGKVVIDPDSVGGIAVDIKNVRTP